MAQIRFYDLEINQPGLIWSPNTCKTRFALNIKNIPYETKWVNFGNLHTIIPSITKSGKRATVPIIEDLYHNNKTVQDSWDIAIYLEEAYPNTPSLFHGNIGLHKFFYDYVNSNILPFLFKLVVTRIADNCGPPKVAKWFRANREKHFGQTLESFSGQVNDNIDYLKKALAPVRKVLKQYTFITGDKVGFADVTLVSYFTMVHAIDPERFELVLNIFNDDIFRNWWNRMEQYRTGNNSARL
ncbi:hypothetical protein BDF21DRAFT_392650 [Thamnidium elegans]|uniref:GST N-terminal domain-containing protein n=1 Tax=Thamnidium elegans TaxID=101142 RepID=A0A8H7VVH7_9FUNG|nr:hypothetical protein INT48_004163 [Thamnidium elegans]KAI8049340.1 hypothetical protein BDF21DRAFT_392650 [Thamnidium elegans]